MVLGRRTDSGSRRSGAGASLRERGCGLQPPATIITRFDVDVEIRLGTTSRTLKRRGGAVGERRHAGDQDGTRSEYQRCSRHHRRRRRRRRRSCCNRNITALRPPPTTIRRRPKLSHGTAGTFLRVVYRPLLPPPPPRLVMLEFDWFDLL